MEKNSPQKEYEINMKRLAIPPAEVLEGYMQGFLKGRFKGRKQGFIIGICVGIFLAFVLSQVRVAGLWLNS